MQDLSEEKTAVNNQRWTILSETRLVTMDVIVYACHDIRTLQSWDNQGKMSKMIPSELTIVKGLNVFNAIVEEYLTLGHAELVPSEDLTKSPSESYYLPMHGVVKELSTTTKLRVVLDASAGYSLNDILLPGPSLLTKMIDQFRLNKIGMSGDISKMFREISLDKTFIV